MHILLNMISEEDDIKFVVKDNNEYELRCTVCNSKLKYPTSWHKHRNESCIYLW